MLFHLVASTLRLLETEIKFIKFIILYHSTWLIDIGTDADIIKESYHKLLKISKIIQKSVGAFI